MNAGSCGEPLGRHAIEGAKNDRLAAIANSGMAGLVRRWRCKPCLLGESQIWIAASVGIPEDFVGRQRRGDRNLLRLPVEIGYRPAWWRLD